jgi:hypothetical protein
MIEIAIAQQDARDAALAQLPDGAVQDEVVDVDGGGHQDAEAELEGEAPQQLRREHQGGQRPDHRPGQQRLGEIACRARPHAAGPRVVRGDPEVLDGMPDGDPHEVVGSEVVGPRLDARVDLPVAQRQRHAEPQRLGHGEQRHRAQRPRRGAP